MPESTNHVNEIESVSNDLFVKLFGPSPSVLVLRVDDDEDADAELRVTSLQDALAFAGDRHAQFYLTTSDGAYTGLAAILKGDLGFAPPTVTLLRERDGKQVGVWMLDTSVPASKKADVAVLEDVAKGLDNNYASDPCPLPGTDGWVVADLDEGRRYAVADMWRAAVAFHGVVDGALLEKSLRLSVGSNAEAENWTPWDTNVVGLLQRLARHEPGTKDGDAILQGHALPGDKRRRNKLVSPDGSRTAKAMEELCLLGLDLDSGEDIDVLRRNIQDAGLFALIWSTHSHMKGVTRIKRDAIMKHATRETGDPTLDECLSYLRVVKRYQDTVLDGATLAAEMDRDHAGFWIVVHHNPMPKYRIIFVLKEPFDPAKQGATHNAGLALWAAKYEAVATKLGAVFDRSCVDVSRLFYAARHTPGERWGVEVIAGQPLDMDTVVVLPRVGRGPAKTGDAYADAADEMGATGLGGDRLGKKFMALYGRRFEVDRFLLETDPDGDRGQLSSRMGRTHCCPNDDQHTRAGDTEDKGFFCIDALEADGGQAVASCRHDSCAGLDRIDFVKLILDREGMGWGDLGNWVPAVEGEEDFDPTLFGKGAVSEATSAKPAPYDNAKAAEEAIAEIPDGDDKAASLVVRTIAVSRKLTATEKATLKDKWTRRTGQKISVFNAEIREAEKATVGKEYEDDDFAETLQAFHRKYHFVAVASQGRFVHETADGDLEFIQPAALTELYEDRALIVPTKTSIRRINPVKAWTQAPEFADHRHQGLKFLPGKTQADAAPYYNLYRGLGVEPRKGSWEHTDRHMLEVVCSGDEPTHQWLKGWMAYVLQNIGDVRAKLTVTPVVWGVEGAGKSIVFDAYRKIFGRHGIPISKSDLAVGKFNGQLGEALFAQMEEAFFAGDPRIKGPLKDLLTGKDMMLEKKGLDAIKVPNYAHFAIVSNEERPVPMDEGSRRFYVIKCSDAKANDSDWFLRILDEQANGGIEAMAWDLLHWTPPNADWKFLREFPRTVAGDRMIAANLTWAERFILTFAGRGAVRGFAEKLSLSDDQEQFISTVDLAAYFTSWVDVEESNPRLRDRIKTDGFAIGAVLKKMLPDLAKPKDTSQRGRMFPTKTEVLKLLRSHRNGGYGAFLEMMDEND